MKTWFAKKRNGDIITLTEREAITHFEDNNIARRMALQFIGTSSGTHFAEARKKVTEFIREKMAENPNFSKMGMEERNALQADLRIEHDDTIREMLDAGYEKELEEAKENGVQRPSKFVRVQTMAEGGSGKASPEQRQKILSEIAGRL